MLLNMEGVRKTYGDRTLLDNVTFYMKQGDRVGSRIFAAEPGGTVI